MRTCTRPQRTRHGPFMWRAALLCVVTAAASACGGGTSVGTEPIAANNDGNNGTNNAPNNTPNNAPNNGTPECGDMNCDPGEEAACPEDCPPDDDCGGSCGEGQSCVSNDAVTGVCYDSDCPDADCESGDVCFDGACVTTSCAGVECGGFPNVCRGGMCTVGSCNDPDVTCPDGQECVNDECRQSCDAQADCGPLACVDGFCAPCLQTEDCEGNQVCVAEQCVAPCTEDPSLCQGDEVCNADTGLCGESCTAGTCVEGQVCDTVNGVCVTGECGENPQVNDCPSGEVCVDFACVGADPEAVVGWCSGCARMESSGYRAIGVLSPVDIVDATATSGQYILQSGVIGAVEVTP